MRRSGRRAKSPLGMSLFPFLAVLLCTMGSLIVLLICLVQRAGGGAPAPSEAVVSDEPSAEDLEKLKNDADDAEFVAKQLKGKKEELSKTLVTIRDEMSIAERMLREQQDEAKLLQLQLAAIRNGGANEDALEAAKDRIEVVKAEIAKLEASLQRKAVEQRSKPTRMSIIPHKGRNGTKQRPIYVECRADRIVIYPEGIEFTDGDFVAASSAGNPLDASLRAVREYYAQKSKEQGPQAPYPLFVVRPGGDIAFIKARAAIVSWEDEFGYELIDDTVELEYPPSDPQLAEVLGRAANDARRRQEALARALPGRFRGSNQGGGGGGTGEGSGGGAPGTAMGSGGGSGNLGGAPSMTGKPGSRFASSKGSPLNGPIKEAGVGGPDSRYADGVAPKNPAKFHYAGSGESKDASKKPGQAAIHHGSKKEGEKDGVPGGEGGAAALEQVQRRGKNWANKSAKASNSPETPVTRTIAARCDATKLTFLPPKGSLAKPIVIEWQGNPVDVVDSIALQVNNRISSWGMAIGGGYWQPVLDIEVASDGEERFAELTQYFDQSGIDVRRRKR